ncbi:MAG: inorganic diphosphatase [Verrucomicrobiota bacterium]
MNSPTMKGFVITAVIYATVAAFVLIYRFGLNAGADTVGADPGTSASGKVDPIRFAMGDVTFPVRNNVFFVPEDPLAGDELSFVVEIPKDSPMKYETRTATGQLFLDRELCPRQVLEEGKPAGWVHGYPAHYGFAAGRFNEDGDPVDLLVFGGDEKYEGMIRDRRVEPQTVRVIGLVKMEECDRLADEGRSGRARGTGCARPSTSWSTAPIAAPA